MENGDPFVDLLLRSRLCRNVILRSGTTKNLLFCFGTQRRFDNSTEEKQILRYRSGRRDSGANEIGRLATPGIPADRVKILREAFMKTVKDAELLDDAKKKRLELDPVSGEDLESLGKEIIAQPPEVVERMKKLLGT
jgi:hypothetical protein